ncbi:MAG: hypothetical protein ACTSRP_01825 [Candidatus Helarchaeota archaeon]
MAEIKFANLTKEEMERVHAMLGAEVFVVDVKTSSRKKRVFCVPIDGDWVTIYGGGGEEDLPDEIIEEIIDWLENELSKEKGVH